MIRGIEGPIVSSASHTMNRYVILILCALMLCYFLFGSQFFFVFYVICFVINIFSGAEKILNFQSVFVVTHCCLNDDVDHYVVAVIAIISIHDS